MPFIYLSIGYFKELFCGGVSIADSSKLIEKHDLPHNHPHIYFSQLYGMSDHLTYNSAEQGYNVVKYVPYGKVKTMIPYLIRSAEENSLVVGLIE